MKVLLYGAAAAALSSSLAYAGCEMRSCTGDEDCYQARLEFGQCQRTQPSFYIKSATTPVMDHETESSKQREQAPRMAIERPLRD